MGLSYFLVGVCAPRRVGQHLEIDLAARDQLREVKEVRSPVPRSHDLAVEALVATGHRVRRRERVREGVVR